MSTHFAFSDYVVLAIYVILMAAIGLFFSKRERSTSDFMLGGRNIAWFAASLSLFMTLFSSISFVAAPGEAFKNGIGMWLGDFLIIFFIPIGMWMFVRFYYRLGYYTPYAYLEVRFNASVRLFASILYLLTRGLYLAIILYATAKISEGTIGWTPWMTIVALGLFAGLLTTVGGMKAVVWTNVAQFFVLVGGILIAIISVMNLIDGSVLDVFRYAFSHGRGINFDKTFLVPNPYERVTLWWLILSVGAAYLSSYATDQMAIQQLLTTRNYKQCKKAAFAFIPVALPVSGLFWFLGLALFCYYDQHPTQIKLNADNVFAYFITAELPSPLPGLVLAGLFAAVLSTLDSGVNSLSTVMVKDIYRRFLHPEASEQHEIRAMRIASISTGVYMILCALIITWVSSKAVSTVYEVSAIWQSLNGIVLGIFILGVCGTRVGTRITITAAAFGLILLLAGVWFFYYKLPEDERMSFIIVGNIGLITTVLIGFLGSIFLPRQRDIKSDGLTLFTLKEIKDE